MLFVNKKNEKFDIFLLTNEKLDVIIQSTTKKSFIKDMEVSRLENINSQFKEIINEKGIKLTKVSAETGIDYQRLNRLFNQNSPMLASELIAMCLFLKIDPNTFCDVA